MADEEELEIKTPFDEDLFKEWKDSRTLQYITVLLLLAAGGWVVWALTIPSEATRAPVFFALFTIGIVFFIADFKEDKQGAVKFIGLGKNRANLAVAIIAGVATIYFLTTLSKGQLSIATPLSSATYKSVSTSLITGLIYFVYVNYMSPILEEAALRMALLPTLINIFGRWMSPPIAAIVAILTQASAFSALHIIAYAGDFNQLVGAFAFAIVVGIGVYIFRSSGFAIAAHFTNNYLAWIRMFGG